MRSTRKNREVTFIILQKNMRSMQSSEKKKKNWKPNLKATDGTQSY